MREDFHYNEIGDLFRFALYSRFMYSEGFMGIMYNNRNTYMFGFYRVEALCEQTISVA